MAYTWSECIIDPFLSTVHTKGIEKLFMAPDTINYAIKAKNLLRSLLVV